MLWRRCSNVVTTSWKHQRATLSQRRKLTLVQLSLSTVPQHCDNINNDVVTTVSQRRFASSLRKIVTRYTYESINILAVFEIFQENTYRDNLSGECLLWGFSWDKVSNFIPEEAFRILIFGWLLKGFGSMV